MEVINGLTTGFEVALQPMNLLYVTLGVLLGTIVGLLPGLGPTAAIAVLLPVTFGMEPTSAIIMLAGIYYGCMYGGRIPAILLNIPGDASSVVTTLDGYPLAKAGRAGPALGITGIGSFIGGTVALLGLTLLAPAVAGWASRVGPPETVVLAAAGLMMVTLVASGSKVKSTIMAMFGLAIAAIGMDLIHGVPRMTFGQFELTRGIDIIPLAVGLFGLSEILLIAEQKIQSTKAYGVIKDTFPSREDWRRTRAAIGRSSLVGFFIGVIPGGGGALSSIVAYGLQKKLSKNPEKFGKGAEDGLAATETADNASSNASFIPLLTLGLPPNSVLALLFGVLVMHNVSPGPKLIQDHPELFWGIVASMYIGNLILVIINLPLIGLFVKILKVPAGILFPIVVVVAFCGVYSANGRISDVVIAGLFGLIGYGLKKFRFDLTPVILGFILGPIIENGFRRSMVMSGGDLSIFLERPGTLTILAIIAILTVLVMLLTRRTTRVIEPAAAEPTSHASSSRT